MWTKRLVLMLVGLLIVGLILVKYAPYALPFYSGTLLVGSGLQMLYERYGKHNPKQGVALGYYNVVFGLFVFIKGWTDL